MKIILNKYKIHSTTYVLFLVSFLCGMFRRVLYLFFIVCFHELGHLFFIKLFHYKVIEVVIYPFGGITRVEHRLNDSIKKEIIISCGGVFFQLILGILVIFSSLYDKELFLFYNSVILIFNLLPIIPLDGSVFVHHLLEIFFSFELSLDFYEAFSVVSLLSFILINYFFRLDNYFICMVLIFQYVAFFKNKKYYRNRFYLERYLYDFPSKKIRNEKGGNYKVLRKNTRHFFYNGKRYETEREILTKVFDKKEYF